MTKQSIVFSGDSVREILDGRKTQTRRVITPQPDRLATVTDRRDSFGFLVERWPKMERMYANFGRCDRIHCPFGVAGSQLSVRETWAVNSVGVAGPPWMHSAEICYRADGAVMEWACPREFVHRERESLRPSWRSPLFLPRWATRLRVAVTDVRVQRVQDISTHDLGAEGIELSNNDYGARNEYRDLWNSLNEKRGYGWDANPWVWAISFRLSSVASG